MSNNFIPQHHNFTIAYSNIARVIQSPCSLGLPFNGSVFPEEYKYVNFKAIWDTGATASVITLRAARELGLIPISKTMVQGVNLREQKNVYAVSLSLPNKVTLPYVQVTECNELSDGYDVLIGMDIIAIGDFALTNSGGQTVFSFRIPSIAKIDFTNPENNRNVTGRPPKETFKNKISMLSRNQGLGKNKKKKP